MARTITDFTPYVVKADLSLREVMLRINQIVPPMLIVATEEMRFLGTITDGDIRRSLLRGASNDATAKDIMHVHSTTGSVRNPQDNRRKLDSLISTIRFLPVLDDDGAITHLLLEDGPALKEFTALVMAGGFGRRLGELTKTTPKPLLPINGRPILDHILDTLEDAGIRRIVLSTHYLAEQIKAFIEQRDNIASMSFVHEETPLGTAGAISLLPQDYRTAGNLIVLNGDVISDLSFASLVSFHNNQQNNATICVKEHRTKIDFGVIRFSDDGDFERIEEKPELSHFIAAGVYLLDPAVTALAHPGGHSDMPDLLNRARDVGLKIGVFPVHEHWVDVGRPHDLLRADKAKRDGKC